MEQQQQYVGIDLHRRRSVVVRRTQSGETLDTVRIGTVTYAPESGQRSLGTPPLTNCAPSEMNRLDRAAHH